MSQLALSAVSDRAHWALDQGLLLDIGQPAGYVGFDGNHAIRRDWSALGVPRGIPVRLSIDLWSPTDHVIWAGLTGQGDSLTYGLREIPLQAGVARTAEIAVEADAMLDTLYIRGRWQFNPFAVGAVHVTYEGAEAPAPSPAPVPAPSPAPPPAVILPGGDRSDYLQHCIDSDTPVDPGIHAFARPLRMPEHGQRLLGGGVRPPRQQARNYGAILAYSGPDAALVCGRRGVYTSNQVVVGVRIEAPNANACILAHNPATAYFGGLSLIGPAAGGQCMLIRGGIQTLVEDVDASGMGIPEFQPLGSNRADGIVFSGGEDEYGTPSTATAMRVSRCYVHQCARGIVNGSIDLAVDGRTVIEDNAIGIYLHDTAKTILDSVYWESNKQPIAGGRDIWLSITNAFMGTDFGPAADGYHAPSVIDVGTFAQIVVSGGYIKGKAPRLLGPRAVPLHAKAALYGTALPPGIDMTHAEIVGPSLIGAGR